MIADKAPDTRNHGGELIGDGRPGGAKDDPAPSTPSSSTGSTLTCSTPPPAPTSLSSTTLTPHLHPLLLNCTATAAQNLANSCYCTAQLSTAKAAGDIDSCQGAGAVLQGLRSRSNSRNTSSAHPTPESEVVRDDQDKNAMESSTGQLPFTARSSNILSLTALEPPSSSALSLPSPLASPNPKVGTTVALVATATLGEKRRRVSHQSRVGTRENTIDDVVFDHHEVGLATLGRPRVGSQKIYGEDGEDDGDDAEESERARIAATKHRRPSLTSYTSFETAFDVAPPPSPPLSPIQTKRWWSGL